MNAISIRRRVGLIVAICLVPSIALLTHANFRERKLIVEQLEQEAVRLVHMTARLHEIRILDARSLLMRMSGRDLLRDADIDARQCDGFLATFIPEGSPYLNAGLVDEKGDILCSALPLPHPVSVEDRPWLRRALQLNAFSLGDYQIGRITGKPALNVAYPFRTATGERRVVYVAIDLNHFATALTTAALPVGAVVSLMDANGAVLARFPRQAVPMQDAVENAHPLFPAMLRADYGAHQSFSMVREGITGACVPLLSFHHTDGNAIVCTELTHGPLLATLRGLLLRNLLGLLFAGGLAFLLARRVGGPMLADKVAAHLHSSDERYRMLFLKSPLPILLFDLHTHRILDANKAALACYDYAEAELLAMGIVDLVDANTSPGVHSGLQRHRGKDGKPIFVELTVTEVTLDGVDVGLMIATDVTAKRRLEAQFLQSQKTEAVGRLAAGVAHDFNNLLTVINMAAGALKDSATDAEAKDDARDILKAAQRGQALTRELLTFARRTPLQPAQVDVAVLVKETETLLRRLMTANIQLVLELPAGLWPVYADPNHLQQVILNLAINAKDAMPSGGRLTIAARNAVCEDGEYLQLTVADTGSGMDAAAKENLFEPFFTTKAAGQGTGLGLATCLGIVQQAGGRIEMQSEVGHGTAFEVYLPKAG